MTELSNLCGLAEVPAVKKSCHAALVFSHPVVFAFCRRLSRRNFCLPLVFLLWASSFFLVSFVFVCFGALSVFPPLSALLPSPAAWCLVEAWWSSLPTWSLRVSQCGILPPCRLIELVRSLLLVCPLSRRAWSILEHGTCVKLYGTKGFGPEWESPSTPCGVSCTPPHDSAEMVCAWYAPI